MQQSFEHFLRNYHRCSKSVKEGRLLKMLTEDEFEGLKNAGLFAQGGDLREVLCPSCSDGHLMPVKFENGDYFTVCLQEDFDRTPVDAQEVRTWDFNIESFLERMAPKLGMEAQVESLVVEGMLQVGTFSRDNTYHVCYFFYGKNVEKAQEFIKKQPSDFRRYVLFANRQVDLKFEHPHECLVLETEHFTTFNNGKLKFKKKAFEEYLTAGFRNVYFNLKNGDLSVEGKVIVTITPSNPEYHFANSLWTVFNQPRTHQKIGSDIYKGTGKGYADTDSKLCHKMKKKIKEGAKKPEIIDQIFQTTKDENGENSYIMKNAA